MRMGLTAMPSLLAFVLAGVAGIAFVWVLAMLALSIRSPWVIMLVGVLVLVSYAAHSVTRRFGVWVMWPMLGELAGSGVGIVLVALALRNMD